MRGFKSLVLRTRDLIPTHLNFRPWVIRQQTITHTNYFLIINGLAINGFLQKYIKHFKLVSKLKCDFDTGFTAGHIVAK